MDIIFMGTPKFASPTLEKLIQSQHNIISVYTRPPKPAHRGKREQITPIHTLAKAHAIHVECPHSLKDHDIARSDVIVLVAYGLMIPRRILDSAKHGCINLHPSLLPRLRGAAPINHTILSGDKETGISIMKMNEELDAGDLFCQENTGIGEDENYETLHDRLSMRGAEMIMEVLENIDKITPKPQGNQGVTYAHKIKKEDYLIDWNEDVEVIERKVRGLHPNACFFLGNERIKMQECAFQRTNHSEKNGQIMNTNMHFYCKNGVIMPKILQRSGKRMVNIKDFLLGFDIKKYLTK